MGCGQSKIHLYPRKSKSKANGKKSGHIDVETDADDEEGQTENGSKMSDNQEKCDDQSENDGKSSPEQLNGEIPLPLWWPQLEHRNKGLSSSQQDFFKMLDQKIEEGPDYDSTSSKEITLEENRISGLLERWESASVTASICSSASRSLQNTPVRQTSMRQGMRITTNQPLNAELLSQQQTQLKQQNNSPKKDGRTLLSQTIIHQSYGVTPDNIQNNRRYWSLPPLLRMQQQPQFVSQYSVKTPPPTLQQQPPQPTQIQQQQRFPPAISVQRLAPQVQRQLRETQELIMESCPQRYTAGYGSPGPPIRSQQRPQRRNTLDSQFSQELS